MQMRQIRSALASPRVFHASFVQDVDFALVWKKIGNAKEGFPQINIFETFIKVASLSITPNTPRAVYHRHEIFPLKWHFISTG